MNKKSILIVFCFLIFGFCLRFLYLNDALWYDEACSWVIAKNSMTEIMNNLVQNDLQHTPLYFFLLHFWIKLFGSSEFVLRSLSLIFGLLTIIIGFIVSKKISDKIVYPVTAFLTLSPILVLFSAEVRMYSAVIFLVLLSLNFLIDFEKENQNSSLIKMGIANILIPYTFVGGILYNISLFICYTFYLYKNKKDSLKIYLKEAITELVLLIPYTILIVYYWIQRSNFVIQHEGTPSFFHTIDVIRNMFGSSVVPNVYWPSEIPYNLTFWFCLSVIVPCVYFVYGYIQSLKSEDKFHQALWSIFLINLMLFFAVSFAKINVCTVRYILYVLPPIIILSILGLSFKLSKRHFHIFICLFLLFSLIFDIKFPFNFRNMKESAFKAVRIESDKLNLSVDDIIIMPFGGDAPYYFRDLTSPRVYLYDFHKVARNPKNKIFYGNTNIMKTNNKFDYIYKKVFEDNVISPEYLDYFTQNVNKTVPKGRFAILALYASDANSMINLEDFRNYVKDEKYVKDNTLDVIFKKSLFDIRAMLNLNFNLVKIDKLGNYTFFIYQKR